MCFANIFGVWLCCSQKKIARSIQRVFHAFAWWGPGIFCQPWQWTIPQVQMISPSFSHENSFIFKGLPSQLCLISEALTDMSTKTC
jgi:hypothetical protein